MMLHHLESNGRATASACGLWADAGRRPLVTAADWPSVDKRARCGACQWNYDADLRWLAHLEAVGYEGVDR